MTDNAPPLDTALQSVSHELMYADKHALAHGEFSLLADRMLAQAIRSRYLDGLIEGGLAAMTLFWLSQYRHEGGVDNIVWAVVSAIVVAVGVPVSIKRHRKRMLAVTALRQAAAARFESGGPCL